jgi:hypothetical protein
MRDPDVTRGEKSLKLTRKGSQMHRPVLRTLRSRSRVEWFLVARTVVVMTILVVAVRSLPYRIWRRLSAADGWMRSRGVAVVVSAPQIVRAVESATRFVPGGANCLARALTTRILMARYGLGSTLRLGVAKAPSGILEAHAWIEYQGAVLVGDRGLDRFELLPDSGARL